MPDAKPMSPERIAEIERDGWCFHTAAREKAQREMIAEIRRLQSAVDRLANNERDLAETNLVLEQQDRDLERQRARISALETALREACALLRTCRSGDAGPVITTSQIDALLAIADATIKETHDPA